MEQLQISSASDSLSNRVKLKLKSNWYLCWVQPKITNEYTNQIEGVQFRMDMINTLNDLKVGELKQAVARQCYNNKQSLSLMAFIEVRKYFGFYVFALD